MPSSAKSLNRSHGQEGGLPPPFPSHDSFDQNQISAGAGPLPDHEIFSGLTEGFSRLVASRFDKALFSPTSIAVHTQLCHAPGYAGCKCDSGAGFSRRARADHRDPDSHFRLVCGAAVSATRNAFGELDRTRILTHVGGLVERGVKWVRRRPAPGSGR